MAEREPIDRVYHYTTKGGFEGIIQEQKVRASSIHQFQDYREFCLGRDQFLKSAKAALAGEEAEAAEEVLLYLLNARRPDLFVCSFTSEADSPLHWRKFGDYAIGFPITKLLDYAGMVGFQVYQCLYDPAHTDIVGHFAGIVSKVISMCGGLKGFRSQFAFSNPLADMFLTLMARYRHYDYAGEKETRIVYHIPRFTQGCKLRVKSRKGGDSSIRYVEFSIKSQELWEQAEVVLGPCEREERQEKLEATAAYLGTWLNHHHLPTACLENIRCSKAS